MVRALKGYERSTSLPFGSCAAALAPPEGVPPADPAQPMIAPAATSATARQIRLIIATSSWNELCLANGTPGGVPPAARPPAAPARPPPQPPLRRPTPHRP